MPGASESILRYRVTEPGSTHVSARGAFPSAPVAVDAAQDGRRYRACMLSLARVASPDFSR